MMCSAGLLDALYIIEDQIHKHQFFVSSKKNIYLYNKCGPNFPATLAYIVCITSMSLAPPVHIHDRQIRVLFWQDLRYVVDILGSEGMCHLNVTNEIIIYKTCSE